LDLDHSALVLLNELRVLFKSLSGSSVHLLHDLGELGGDVGSVAIQNWGVSVTDLTWVVKNDNLSFEVVATLSWLVLGIRADESSFDILNGDSLNVESDVVTRVSLWENFVVHFDGFDFSGYV